MLQPNDQPISDPIFPVSSEVGHAVNQRTKQTAVVLTMVDRRSNRIDVIMDAKDALALGQDIIASAVSAMDEDEVDQLENISIIRLDDGSMRINGVTE